MTRIASRSLDTCTMTSAKSERKILARIADYIELTKPRIVALELVTVAVAAVVAAPRSIQPWILLHTVFGAGLVAASAGAFNQWLEQETDRRMPRTADRPLPAGRLSGWEVLALGVVTLLAGFAELSIFVNMLTALLGLAVWMIYVLVYTPLKSVSPVNTAVGAVAGALPILLGWSATGAAIDGRALAITGVLFLWQFPHFMAIAWLYRKEYSAAGQQMLTVVDPSGIRAGSQAVTAALALIPMSLLVAIVPHSTSPTIYSLWSVALGAAFCLTAVLFFIDRNDKSARRLLLASLLYLPCWLGLLVMVSV